MAFRPFQSGRVAHSGSLFGDHASLPCAKAYPRGKSKAGPGAPKVDPNLSLIGSPARSCQLTWIGHASFLLQISGCNLLIDPVFQHRRIGQMKRYVPPGLEITDLPSLDGVLITHGHRDHLDEWTLRRLSPETRVLVPSGLGPTLHRFGFKRVEELDWWRSTDFAGTALETISVTLTPAHHGPVGPRAPNASTGGCGGFVVESSRHGVYHAGDSGPFDGFAQVGARFPNLDAALLPVGSYRRDTPDDSDRHLNPEEAGQAFLDSGACRLVPMHWGTFQLADESLREGPDRLRSWWIDADVDAARRLTEMAVGETIGWNPDN